MTRCRSCLEIKEEVDSCGICGRDFCTDCLEPSDLCPDCSREVGNPPSPRSKNLEPTRPAVSKVGPPDLVFQDDEGSTNVWVKEGYVLVKEFSPGEQRLLYSTTILSHEEIRSIHSAIAKKAS